MKPVPAGAADAYRRQRVRRYVSPYNPWDYAVVVKNNLRRRPTSRHADRTSFVPGRFDLVDVTTQLRVGFLGDLMPCGRRSVALSDELVGFLAGLDRLVVNFEGVVHEGPGPTAKVLMAQVHRQLAVLDALDATGLDRKHILVSVANNHAADFGFDDFLATVGRLEGAGYRVVGSAWDAAVDLDPAVNLVAATEWTNQRHDYLSFLGDADRWLQPDRCNLLVPHWGRELETHPRPADVERARLLLGEWDAIVGHHSHVPGPVARYEIGRASKVVAYSLGDAATALSWPFYQHGLALRLDIGPDPSGRWRVGGGQWTFVRSLVGEDAVHVVASSRCPYFPGVAGSVVDVATS